jgi:hypothetical protein
LFIALQQNTDTIKVENDSLIKENSIDVKTDQICAPAACSIKEAELKFCFQMMFLILFQCLVLPHLHMKSSLYMALVRGGSPVPFVEPFVYDVVT